MENSVKKQEIIKQALDFLYPPRCLFCQKMLDREAGEEPPLCPSCQAQFPAAGANGRQEGQHFRSCLSAVYYTDLFKPSFHRYKFQRRWHYSHLYGQWMSEALSQQEPDFQRFDCVSWTPLSMRRWLTRGYDQSKRLAQEVAHSTGLPLVPLLYKWKHIAPQSGTKSAEERRANIQGVYRLARGADVTGNRILLVDDIVTTGSTLEEASRVLMENGAAEVCCLTLARSEK